MGWNAGLTHERLNMEPNDTNENTQRTPSAHTGQSEILPHVRVCCEVDTNIESVDVFSILVKGVKP